MRPRRKHFRAGPELFEVPKALEFLSVYNVLHVRRVRYIPVNGVTEGPSVCYAFHGDNVGDGENDLDIVRVFYLELYRK